MKNMQPIIPVSVEKCQEKSWKYLLKTAIKDPFSLIEQLGLNSEAFDFEFSPSNQFAMRVPQPFIDKMVPGDPKDPLLLQVISQSLEDIEVPGYTNDPLEEKSLNPPGLLHKYHSRVLLILASACAVNCRYCFRRHFPYQDKQASGDELNLALQYIAQRPQITEVILSGGDPLILNDSQLIAIIEQIEQIKHVNKLRIHTRLPVVIPQRITDKLVAKLASTRLVTNLVLHINHANEIDQRFVQAMDKLRQAKVFLLNQSVILKGINDCPNKLASLSEKLYQTGIIPYYLHLLDKVAGAAHFDLAKDQAVQIVEQMRKMLPGYLVPRLACEQPGKSSKTVIV
ncbi:EF-P beta-lysylation protein EpmB [Aliikangiella sp. IMCC44653]